MGFWVGYYYFQTPAERLANALKTTTSTTSPTTTTSTTNTTSTPAPTTNTASKTNTATATWQKISQQNNSNLSARTSLQATLKNNKTLSANLAAIQSTKKQLITPKKVTYDDSEYITENGIDYHVVGGVKYQIISKFPTEAEIASKQFHAGDSAVNNNSLNLGIPGVSNASTSGGTKSASGGKTTTTTSVYDISQNLKDVQAQAKQYGASVALPKTTSYKTQAEAQKALDSYVASTNKALEAKINSNVASAQPQAAAPTRGYYDGLTPTQRNEVDSWNQNNKAQGINDAINPDWVVWRNYKLSGPEPAKFWKDATNSSARDEYQARMDAEHAESQRQLAEAYAATQRAAGTTHAKSTTAVTNNGKSSSQIYNEQKSLKPSTSKLQVVSAKTVAPSVAAKSQPVVVKKTVEPVVVKKPTTKELMAINSKTKQTKPTIVKSTSAKPVAVSLANKNNLQRTQTIQAASHAGQIQLKNGTWIDKIQKTGAANPNSGKTSIFSESAKVHYDTKVANARAAQAAFEANRAAAGSGKLVDNKGYAINQITDKSGNTKISRNTLGQAITISTPVVVAGQSAYYTRSGGQTAKDQRDAEKSNYSSPLGAQYRREDSTVMPNRSVRAPALKTRRQYMQEQYISKPVVNVTTPVVKTTISVVRKAGETSVKHSKPKSEGARVGEGLIALTTGDVRQNVINGGVAYLELAKAGQNMLDTGMADIMRPGFNVLESTAPKVINNSPIGLQLRAAGKARDMLGAVQQGVEKENPWLNNYRAYTLAKQTANVAGEVQQGVIQFAKDEYTSMKEHPFTYGAMIGLTAGTGAALGAGIKGVKLLGTGTLAKAADIAVSRGGKGVWGVVNKGSTALAKIVPIATDSTMLYTMGTGVHGSLAKSYEDGGVAGATKGVLTLGKELAIGAKPWKYGEGLPMKYSSGLNRLNARMSAGKYEPYTISDIPLPRTGWAQVPQVKTEGANLITENYRYGVSLKLGNDPLVTFAKGDNGKIKISRGAAPIPRDVVMTKVTPVTPKVTAAKAGVKAVEATLKRAEHPSLIELDDAIKSGRFTIEKSTIRRVAGSGGSTQKVPKAVGVTLTASEKPIISISTSGKVSLGKRPEASERLLSENISAYNQQQTSTETAAEAEVFGATLKKVAEEPERDVAYWENIRLLNEKIETYPFNVELPKKMELLSNEVPEKLRQPTLDIIREYGKTHKVQLSGSAATKPQMGDYMARDPNDFEFYAQDELDAMNAIVAGYKKRGFVEGKDFKVFHKERKYNPETKLWRAPSVAIEYPIKLKPGEKYPISPYTNKPMYWKEGGSIFTHDFKTAPETHDIFAGFVERESVVVDNTPLLSLPEQIHRKSDSSTFLTKDPETGKYEVGARFDKALKHIADVVDMSTYAANEAGIPVSDEIVNIVKLTHEKYANHRDAPYTDKQGNVKDTVWKETYKEKVLGDQIFKFILDNERLPTPKEVHAPRAKDGSIIIDKSVPKSWKPTAKEFTPEELEAVRAKLGVSKDTKLTKEQKVEMKKKQIEDVKTELKKTQEILVAAEKAAERKAEYPTFQSFSRSETPYFKKTVATIGGKTEATYLNSALNIADASYKLSKPIYTPENFEITSTAVPKRTHEAITQSILGFANAGHEIRVAGSVPMKAQSTPFTTRETHDLEIYTDDMPTFMKHIETDLKAAGFKAGVDYKLTGHQVQFKGKSGWDTGIEVFDHKPAAGYIPDSSHSEIAFGYREKAALEVGVRGKSKKINEQELTEQITRKVAGSTMLKGAELQPSHPGRVKDIRDVVTSATAVSNSGSVELNKTRYDKNIVDFVNASVQKYKGHKEFGENFKDVMDDPVFAFIYKNQRVPTAAEVFKLTGEKPVEIRQTLFDSKVDANAPIKTGNSIVDAELNNGRGSKTSPFGSKTAEKTSTPFDSTKSNKAIRERTNEVSERNKATGNSNNPLGASEVSLSKPSYSMRSAANADTGSASMVSPFSRRSFGSSVATRPSAKSSFRPNTRTGSSFATSARSPISPRSPMASSGSSGSSSSSFPSSKSSMRSSAKPSPQLSSRAYPRTGDSLSITRKSNIYQSPSIISGISFTRSSNVPSISSVSFKPSGSISPSSNPSGGSSSSGSRSASGSLSSSSSSSSSSSGSSSSGSSGSSSSSFPSSSSRSSSASSIQPPSPKKIKDRESRQGDILKAIRARDKALVSKTKVASFSQMYGTSKKSRASPFKK